MDALCIYLKSTETTLHLLLKALQGKLLIQQHSIFIFFFLWLLLMHFFNVAVWEGL